MQILIQTNPKQPERKPYNFTQITREPGLYYEDSFASKRFLSLQDGTVLFIDPLLESSDKIVMAHVTTWNQPVYHFYKCEDDIVITVGN